MPQSMLTTQEKADGDALVHFLLTDARTEEEEEFAQDVVLWWTLAKGEQAYKDVEINRDRMHDVLNPLNADLAAAAECRLLTHSRPQDICVASNLTSDLSSKCLHRQCWTCADMHRHP